MTTRHENHPNSAVSLSRVVVVNPKLLQPQRVLQLSNLDRQCPTLMYLVFFYNPSQAFKDLSLNSVFNDLKSGLEETLTLWYPAAGRLTLNQSDGKLNLWCNNQGAILVEAHTSLKISQLGDLSQYNNVFESLVYKPPFDGNFSSMPLVVAQVTKFGCGGYSIGIGTSHSLFDGPATYDFLSAWASSSAIFFKGKRVSELQKPVHERGILLTEGNGQAPKGSNNLPTNSNLNQQQTIRATAIQHLYHLIMQAASEQKDFPLQIGRLDQNNCVLKTYHLSGAMIDYLKRKLVPIRGSLPFSTFEVLATHLWKARTKALRLRKEKMVCLQFAVDTRNKTVPPLPRGFSGNAYVLASVMMTVKELEEASQESVIEQVREAKNAVNHDYVKAYVDALGGAGASLPPLRELTLVSDWTRMPFHNVDFFREKAAYTSPLASPIPQVAYFMQNPNHNSSVDVRIGLGAETINAFSDYFLVRGQ
ncbi:hypothetical protein L6164_015700 [Bauhinia variegata]|uniref:Uncharacterized protein n=1 Tax=Bauhinia variegata TaxID=167791 RepID=A0ACB9NQ54_BAUVA|nr:hypothetical protein L6164_015700 [Bauhinia variegata]